jgi:sn-glycerol 3-phosphate transport system substrate-binding protein
MSFSALRASQRISLISLSLAALCAVAAPAHAAKAAKAPAAAPAKAAPQPQGPIELSISHQLDAAHAARLQEVLDRFNAQQKDYKVQLVARGETAVPHHMHLAVRDELSQFVSGKESFRPLFQVIADSKEKVDAARLAPELRSGVTDGKGRLLALPVAFSTPVLFYSKSAFRRAGLDPETPPKTWWEVQATAGKLFDSGLKCPYTTSWPTWVHIDNLAARNNVEIVGEKGEMAFNGMMQVKHVALLNSWYKARYFHTFGPKNEADSHFASGECGMITTSSDRFVAFRDNKDLDVGVAPLPYYDEAYGAPRQALADGASLWVEPGRKPAEYKGVARFVAFLMAPDMQVEIARSGGYLPLTAAAQSAAKSKLLKDDMRNIDVAQAQLGSVVPRTAVSKAAALTPVISRIEPVRRIIEEELEQVWANKKPAKLALDNAVTRANAALRSGAAPRLAEVAAPTKVR